MKDQQHRMQILGLFDSFSTANLKNRKENCTLATQLSLIDKQKKIELALLENEKRQFLSKFTKKHVDSLRGVNPHVPQEISRRNDSKNESQYQNIYSIIFTNGEVDIEKLLCLHLLSVHSAMKLAAPKRLFKSKILNPVQRLIEQSVLKPKQEEQLEYFARHLPLYDLEIIVPANYTGGQGYYHISDRRLESRILINCKIVEIELAVLTTLHECNQHKLNTFLNYARDTEFLIDLLYHKHIQNFFKTLHENPLINSCNSFILLSEDKYPTIHLKVQTPSGHLERLITDLRYNVLEFRSWTSRLVKSTSSPDLDQTKNMNSKQDSRRNSNTSNNRRDSSSTSDRQSRRLSNQLVDEDKLFGRHITQNFVQKNIEAAKNHPKIEYDTEDQTISPSKRRTSSTSETASRRTSLMPYSALRISISPRSTSNELEKVDEGSERDANVANSDEQVYVDEEIDLFVNSRRFSGGSGNKKRLSTDSEKSYIRQTTCPACLAKFKTAHPTPKTPRIRKDSIIPNQSNEFNLNQPHNNPNRVSTLINKELYTLDAYDRRFSGENSTNFKKVNSSNQLEDGLNEEAMRLKSIDLAKIQQEIKQKETQKKLENFLSKSL